MVVADFNIFWDIWGASAAEHNVFAGRLQKIVHNLVRPHGAIANPAHNRLRVRTRTDLGYAMEVVEGGIHHRHITAGAQHDAARGCVLRVAMYPKAIEHQMVGRSLELNQIGDVIRQYGPHHLQTDQAVMISSSSEHDRPRAPTAVEFNLGQYIGGCLTLASTASTHGRNACAAPKQ